MGWVHGGHSKESNILSLRAHVRNGGWLSHSLCFHDLQNFDLFLLTLLFIEYHLGAELQFYLRKIDRDVEYVRKYIEQKKAKRKSEW